MGFDERLAVGESDKEVLAVGELVGFDEGLAVGESDEEVLAVGELVGFDKGLSVGESDNKVLGRSRHCSGNYEARGASGGKYEARIVIFRILAAIDRFSRIFRKAESRQGKSESR